MGLLGLRQIAARGDTDDMNSKIEAITGCQPSIQPIGPMPRWQIRTFLVWLVLASLLPGMIGATFLFVRDYWDGRTQLEKDTISTARALAQAVDSRLLKAKVMAQTLSTASALTASDLARFHERARRLLALTGGGTNVVLSDETGQQLVNTLREYSEPLPRHGNLDLVRRVFATGQPVISDIYIGGVVRRPVMSIDVPVILNNKVVYDLSVGLLPDYFNGILAAQGLPPDWVAAIFDSTGTIVARTHTPDRFVGQKGTAEFIQRIKQSQEGSVETATREGIPVLSVWSRSPVTGWSVGIGIPRKNLEDALIRTLSVPALGMVVLLVIGVSLASRVGVRIARSVRALSVPALALGAGESSPIPQLEIKEAAEVALAIDHAGGLLKERTRALEQANQSLLAREAELLEAHRLARFGTWHWNLKTGEVHVSESIREIYGREVPSFPEQRGTLLPAESWDKVQRAAQEAVRTGIGYDLQLPVIHGSGSMIWVNAKCEAVRDANGEISALRGTVQDITERKRAQQALLESETRFRSTFEQAAVGIAHVSVDGRWLQVNDKLCEIVGYERQALLKLTFQDITYPPDLAADLVSVEQLLMGAIPNYRMEKRYVRRDGSLVWIDLTVSLVRTQDGEPDYLVAVVEDIQRRKEAEAALEAAQESHRQHLEQQVADRTAALVAANQELAHVARKDALTGLQNRISANERLHVEFLRLKRTGSSYAVLFMDIDHFKQINDTYGHHTGDHILQQFASVLEGAVRESDFVARFGGEEFLAILLDTNTEGALRSAEKIRRAVAERSFPVVGQLTLSMGVATARAEDGNEDEAVRRADAALYQAKRDGRNRVRAG